MILAVILIGLIAAPLALLPVKSYAAWYDLLGIGNFTAEAIQGILDVLANSTLLFAGLITAFAGMLFNLSVAFSLHIKDFLDTTPFIDTAWATFRDIANMFFIFILLYVAIKTILGDNPGKMLTSIIITALLVNFSMFFTKVVIDASNILALNFYNAINVPKSTEFNIADSKTWSLGLSDPFMAALAIQTTYPKDADLTNTTYSKLFAAAGAAITQRILSQTVGVLVMLIAAFVFFAGAWMFIARTVILLFLLMFSPIAVVSRLLPKSKAIWDKWSETLIKQLIFAPAFMIMIWVVLNILKANAIKKLMSGGFAGALQGDVNAFGVIFGYAFIIALLIMTLIVSQVVGGKGATTLIGWGQALRKGAQGFAGRHTIGRAAYGAQQSLAASNFAQNNPRTALALSNLLNRTSGASFGGARGGYSGAVKQQQKRAQQFGQQVFGQQGGQGRGGGNPPPGGGGPGTPPIIPPSGGGSRGGPGGGGRIVAPPGAGIGSGPRSRTTYPSGPRGAPPTPPRNPPTNPPPTNPSVPPTPPNPSTSGGSAPMSGGTSSSPSAPANQGPAGGGPGTGGPTNMASDATNARNPSEVESDLQRAKRDIEIAEKTGNKNQYDSLLKTIHNLENEKRAISATANQGTPPPLPGNTQGQQNRQQSANGGTTTTPTANATVSAPQTSGQPENQPNQTNRQENKKEEQEENDQSNQNELAEALDRLNENVEKLGENVDTMGGHVQTQGEIAEEMAKASEETTEHLENLGKHIEGVERHSGTLGESVSRLRENAFDRPISKDELDRQIAESFRAERNSVQELISNTQTNVQSPKEALLEQKSFENN